MRGHIALQKHCVRIGSSVYRILRELWSAYASSRRFDPGYASHDEYLDLLSLQSCCRDRSVEIVRQCSFKTLPFASARVTKTELPCVQHLAGKMFGERGRVNFVAQHRITKMMQMHPNLMRAATVQCAFNQTRLVGGTENAIFSLGRATVG